ncbi:hypothetical protein HPB47_006104 [Ixodes persulcatus]|uniref:Uncharacterized protein n=1 Tax=Ixodes persulcatus TaxID=34615 RepID=A0AC60PBS6_IXOPE|nr:hypothetical protein HPB47_006104 [Ixodes persulcatus]
MKKLMQPFKVGEDVGLFLVNFERTCEKLSFAPETWPQRLLTLLPCEAAEVVARLSAGDADDYDKVKSSLLKRYRLSAEAFRQRFRNASKKSSEGYSEFAYGLKTNLIEWLKSEEVYESRDKVVECVCLEQFFRSIPQSVKLWVQDRVGVDSVERATELAEEYATRRKLSGEESESGRSDQRNTFRQGNDSRENGPEKPEAGQKVPEKSTEHSNGDEARKSPTGQFEARKPFLCYNCQEPGHTAARCKKPRVVFSYVNGSDEDLKLLRPYLHELHVNGKPCRVLRDSAATMDVVHPSLSSSGMRRCGHEIVHFGNAPSVLSPHAGHMASAAHDAVGRDTMGSYNLTPNAPAAAAVVAARVHRILKACSHMQRCATSIASAELAPPSCQSPPSQRIAKRRNASCRCRRKQFKIGLRPRNGLGFRMWKPYQLIDYLANAARAYVWEVSDAAHLQVNHNQNILANHTEDEKMAQALSQIHQLVLGGRSYLSYTYLAAPNDSVKGVIHEFNSALVNFSGQGLPHNMAYYSSHQRVTPYRPTQAGMHHMHERGTPCRRLHNARHPGVPPLRVVPSCTRPRLRLPAPIDQSSAEPAGSRSLEPQQGFESHVRSRMPRGRSRSKTRSRSRTTELVSWASMLKGNRSPPKTPPLPPPNPTETPDWAKDFMSFMREMARLQETMTQRLNVHKSEPKVAKRTRRSDVHPQPYVIPNAPQQPSSCIQQPTPLMMAGRNKGTVVWQQNFRSFRGKRGALAKFTAIRDFPPDVICPQETGRDLPSLSAQTQEEPRISRSASKVKQHEFDSSSVEHAIVDFLPKKRKSPSFFILNVYRPPCSTKYVFERIFAHAAPTQAEPSSGRRYRHATVKGTKLHEAICQHQFTLLTDPEHPTHTGNSVNRDMCPDLTLGKFTAADWTNTGESLGSDHSTIEKHVCRKAGPNRLGRVPRVAPEGAYGHGRPKVVEKKHTRHVNPTNDRPGVGSRLLTSLGHQAWPPQ